MTTDSVAGLPIWTRDRARLALVLVHLPVFAILPVTVLQGYPAGVVTAPVEAMSMALAMALAALEMRTGLAVAEDRRPSHVAASVAAVVVAAVALWYLVGWPGTYGWLFVAATALLLLPSAAGLTACAVVLCSDIWWVFARARSLRGAWRRGSRASSTT